MIAGDLEIIDCILLGRNLLSNLLSGLQLLQPEYYKSQKDNQLISVWKKRNCRFTYSFFARIIICNNIINFQYSELFVLCPYFISCEEFSKLSLCLFFSTFFISTLFLIVTEIISYFFVFLFVYVVYHLYSLQKNPSGRENLQLIARS